MNVNWSHLIDKSALSCRNEKKTLNHYICQAFVTGFYVLPRFKALGCKKHPSTLLHVLLNPDTETPTISNTRRLEIPLRELLLVQIFSRQSAFPDAGLKGAQARSLAHYKKTCRWMLRIRQSTSKRDWIGGTGCIMLKAESGLSPVYKWRTVRLIVLLFTNSTPSPQKWLTFSTYRFFSLCLEKRWKPLLWFLFF